MGFDMGISNFYFPEQIFTLVQSSISTIPTYDGRTCSETNSDISYHYNWKDDPCSIAHNKGLEKESGTRKDGGRSSFHRNLDQ